MKLTSRVYLDYNSTSPLSSSVKSWLARGDFYFANPSSIHSSGKKAKRYISESKDYLLNFFNLNDSHELFFHSGATEGINNIFKGLLMGQKKQGNKLSFYVSMTDHSCIYNQVEDLELLGASCYFIPICRDGLIDWPELEAMLKADKNQKLVNMTWINNETGVINSLEHLVSLKKKVDFIAHVDAVQSVGKMKDFNLLKKEVDLYTYSAHKFGALKGVGFTFYPNKNFCFSSQLRGGGQQVGMRSGTENTLGIYSIKLALEDLVAGFNWQELKKCQEKLEQVIEDSLISNGGYIVAKNADRSLSTSYFIIKNRKADVIIMAFDMAGIDVSTGSACSSGAVEPSRVLLNLGLAEDEAKGAIRISFSPLMNLETMNDISLKVGKILGNY